MKGRASFALAVLLLAGCATVSFRRGASPDAMSADEQACRAASASHTDYLACMRGRGWFIAGGGEDARTAAALPSPTPTPHPELPAAAPATPHPEDALEPQADPKIKVGSWWKLGGSASDFDAAVGRCTAKLGDAHRPNAGATLVTPEMRDCLRDAGWFALAASD